MDSFLGAQISKGGRIIFGLPSRNLHNESNIKLSIDRYSNRLGFEESIDMVVTEYGTAMMNGLSIRERAQAIMRIFKKAVPNLKTTLAEGVYSVIMPLQ